MGKRKANFTGLARFLSQTVESSSHSPTLASTLAEDKNQVILHNASSPHTHDTRPTKKAKFCTGLLGPDLERYDATGLVPFYKDPYDVPAHLQKYFSQRERYFSLYSKGCLLDEEGWYSVTPESIADQIAERCRCDVILDAFCGVGGNAIAFARKCERVIALDVSPVRLALARHNAALYGVEDRIEFILADFFSFARTLTERQGRKVDVVFLSPPWGGPSYLSSSPTKGKPQSPASSSTLALDAEESSETYSNYSLESIRPVHGEELFKIARGITRNIAYFLPRNACLKEISQLIAKGPSGEASSTQVEKVEVEEEWMGSKLKALTCYFGGLVGGQEALFDQCASQTTSFR